MTSVKILSNKGQKMYYYKFGIIPAVCITIVVLI